MTIYERALELIVDGGVIGLGSGRAATAFMQALAARVQAGRLKVRGVPTSRATAELATQLGIPLATLAEVPELAMDVDGADEVAPNLDLIKGYGRALVREKIVAAASRQVIILVTREKLVQKLGTRGKLPVEVLEFALPLCERRLRDLGCRPVPCVKDDCLFLTDNGNPILDCEITPIPDPAQLDQAIRAIPGVVGTGLFLGMATRVLVGEPDSFALIEERVRPA
jgi:ribose 5-phosphate isomerase A